VASEKPGGLSVPYGAESIDAFLEVRQGRRSIRTGFLRDKPVPDKLIEMEAARWAPSAGNSQPWEFLVIRSLEIREKIVEIFKTQMRDKIEIEEATRGQRRRVTAGIDFRHAPVHGYRRTRRIRAHEIATEMLSGPRPRFETRNSLPAFETLVAILPEAQREVVTMKAGGLSLEEVARATSCTVGAVKQKASRAYERLRRLLQEEKNELP
jgi:nitroreductase